jgi:hypothetical protein
MFTSPVAQQQLLSKLWGTLELDWLYRYNQICLRGNGFYMTSEISLCMRFIHKCDMAQVTSRQLRQSLKELTIDSCPPIVWVEHPFMKMDLVNISQKSYLVYYTQNKRRFLNPFMVIIFLALNEKVKMIIGEIHLYYSDFIG